MDWLAASSAARRRPKLCRALVAAEEVALCAAVAVFGALAEAAANVTKFHRTECDRRRPILFLRSENLRSRLLLQLPRQSPVAIG